MKKPTKKLADEAGVSRRYARRLKARGIDTPEKAAVYRAATGRMRASKETGDEVMKNWAKDRARKMHHDANIAEIEDMERQKALVEVARVMSALDKAESTRLAQERAAFVVELPAQLGGQPGDKIAAAYEKKLNQIHEEFVKTLKTLAGV